MSKVRTDRDLRSADRAFLVGHHFLAVPGNCEGCGRNFDDLEAEARAASDDMSRCPTPHADAEIGQILNLGPRR